MLFIKESPFVRQAIHSYMDMSSASKDLFQPLRSKDSRLFYILAGAGAMNIDGKTFPLQANTLLLFKAGTPYEWQIEYADYYAVNFDYSQSFSHIQQRFHPMRSHGSGNTIFDCGTIEDCPALEAPIILYDSITFKRSIQNLLAESAIADHWNKPILSAMMKRLLLEILRKNEKQDKRFEAALSIKEVIVYIQDHYLQPINNRIIAEQFGYNPTYLGRIFKAQTGTTLHNFVTELRLNTAMELLSDTTLPISQICVKIGIPDVYYFSKYFKKKVGVTPSQYRKKK